MIFIKKFAEDAETRFVASNYELDKPFPKEKNEKVYWLSKAQTRRINNERICWIKSKNLQLFNR